MNIYHDVGSFWKGLDPDILHILLFLLSEGNFLHGNVIYQTDSLP